MIRACPGGLIGGALALALAGAAQGARAHGRDEYAAAALAERGVERRQLKRGVERSSVAHRDQKRIGGGARFCNRPRYGTDKTDNIQLRLSVHTFRFA